jgi:hypothetical protein
VAESDCAALFGVIDSTVFGAKKAACEAGSGSRIVVAFTAR